MATMTKTEKWVVGATVAVVALAVVATVYEKNAQASNNGQAPSGPASGSSGDSPYPGMGGSTSSGASSGATGDYNTGTNSGTSDLPSSGGSGQSSSQQGVDQQNTGVSADAPPDDTQGT